MNKDLVMKKQNTGTAPEMQGDPDLSGLHEYVRERGESARLDVANWNARVELWRSRYGDKEIPEKMFEQHPAAEMIRQWLLPDELGSEFADFWAAKILSLSNSTARTESEGCKRFAAVRLDTIDKSDDQMAAFQGAELCNVVSAALDTLLLLRTTTAEDLAGLPIEKIPGCILVRTADVRESDANAR